MSRNKKTSSPRGKAGESTDSPPRPAVLQDQPVNGDAPPVATARADDEKKEEPKWEKWGKRAALVLTLVSAVLSGLFWLDSRINSRIDQAVTERVEPYEHFLLGMGAVNDEEYDRAIPDFDKAFDALEKRGGPKEELVPLIDYYLYAIVNSEHPAKHSSQFNKIKQTINDHSISPDAYCFHQIGWYYLRTGELEKAREQFLSARDKYAEEERYRASADTYWALGMIALADGDVDAAVKMAQEAASKNPTQYALKTLVQDEGAKREDNWYKLLMRLYPKIGSTWPDFFNRLKQLSATQK